MITNIDRIRNMSAEELSIFLEGVANCYEHEDCKGCPLSATCLCDAYNIQMWLESEFKPEKNKSLSI